MSGFSHDSVPMTMSGFVLSMMLWNWGTLDLMLWQFMFSMRRGFFLDLFLCLVPLAFCGGVDWCKGLPSPRVGEFVMDGSESFRAFSCARGWY